MKQTLIDHIHHHSATGVWTGATENGVAVISYQGRVQPVEPFLKQLGIKLADSNKYTERKENAGMGKTQSGGDTSDTRDGISQSKE